MKMKKGKIVAFALATLIITNLSATTNVVHAGSGLLSGLAKTLSVQVGSEKMIPDGRVYSGGRSYDRDNRVTNVYSVKITQPSILHMNFVNDGNENFIYNLLDAKSSPVKSNVGVGRANSSYDFEVDPGSYYIEVRGLSNYKGHIAFRVSATAEELKVSGVPQNTSYNRATPIYFNSVVNNYFANRGNHSLQTHYYVFDINQDTKISIQCSRKNDSGADPGSFAIELCERNGDAVGPVEIKTGGAKEISCTATPGRYYIKVNSTLSKGVVYNLVLGKLD